MGRDNEEQNDLITAIINKADSKAKQKQARVHHNATCLKCGNCFPQMVMIGPMVFDKSCYVVEFGDTLEVDSQSKQYVKWLKKHKKMIVDRENM